MTFITRQDIEKIVTQWDGKILRTDYDSDAFEYLSQFLEGAGYDHMVDMDGKVNIQKRLKLKCDICGKEVIRYQSFSRISCHGCKMSRNRLNANIYAKNKSTIN